MKLLTCPGCEIRARRMPEAADWYHIIEENRSMTAEITELYGATPVYSGIERLCPETRRMRPDVE